MHQVAGDGPFLPGGAYCDADMAGRVPGRGEQGDLIRQAVVSLNEFLQPRLDDRQHGIVATSKIAGPLR